MCHSFEKNPGFIKLENGGYWLLIDKPSGMTSHDVIDHVRRYTGEKKVGHAGTLDPMATGLLVVALGKATKLLDSGLKGGKQYLATAKFGLGTPTGDTDSEWNYEVDSPEFTVERIENLLSLFTGKQQQIPPMISSIKRFGQRFYKVARRGWYLERESREVTISDIHLVEFDQKKGVVKFMVSGGGGLYVRSIIRDMGSVLGIPAAMIDLRRISSGDHNIENAITLDQLETIGKG